MEDKINVMMFANGSLSSAFARIFNKSNLLNKLYICALNGKLYINENNTEVINPDRIRNLRAFINENQINFIIVFDESRAQGGIVNLLKYNLSVPTLGITRYWMQLENSKRFAKEFMIDNNIPTPQYAIINNLYDLNRIIKTFDLPLVIKNNGLQQGFGSFICKTEKECVKTAKKLLKDNKFFIAEKFIEGEEVTLHTIWDGDNLIPLEPVRDYKKLKNHNEGINTGSLGSYIPVEIPNHIREKIDDYTKKLEAVFREKKPNFTGIFASDLIYTDNEVYNLEFNMRPCTPEFEVLAEHLKNDLLEVFYNIATDNCKDLKFEYKTGKTGCVNVVHKDYKKHLKKYEVKKVKVPEAFLDNNCEIVINKNFVELNKKNEAKVSIQSRVLSLLNNDLNNPFPLIYKYAKKIKDKNLYYRTDIGE